MTSIQKYLIAQNKDKSNKLRFYIYAYIRSKDSETAKAGTPYYIGKGCGKRAWINHGRVNIPPNENNIVILECNLTEIGALALESFYIRWYGRKELNNGILINKSGGGEGVSGFTAVKDKNGNKFSVSVNDERYLSGELVGVTAGIIITKDKDNNIFRVTKGDELYLSGELVSMFHGKITAKDKDNNIFRVTKDDPRFLSGELVGIASGITPVKDKDGNKFRVSVDDPRFLSGELVGVFTNMFTAKDKDGNVFSISKDDPRVLSGELVSIIKDTTIVKDKDGNKFRVSVDDPRFLSGELVGQNKGYFTAFDLISQTTTLTHKNDPRFLSGELVGVMKKNILAKDSNNALIYVSPKDYRWLTKELTIVHK